MCRATSALREKDFIGRPSGSRQDGCVQYARSFSSGGGGSSGGFVPFSNLTLPKRSARPSPSGDRWVTLRLATDVTCVSHLRSLLAR